MGNIWMLDNVARELAIKPRSSYVLIGETNMLKDDEGEMHDLIFQLYGPANLSSFSNEKTSLSLPVVYSNYREARTRNLLLRLSQRHPQFSRFYVERASPSIYRAEVDRMVIEPFDYVSKEKVFEFAGREFKQRVEELSLDTLE